MDEDLSDFFARVLGDKRLIPEARGLAAELETTWRLGVIPSPNRVRQLRSMLAKTASCDRLEWDGSCDWLRQNAARHGLPQTPIGSKALCQFCNNWTRCPGFQQEVVG